jgi:transketolase
VKCSEHDQVCVNTIRFLSVDMVEKASSGHPALDQLERFRQWESKTPGHPESDVTGGVEASTGPLGQGIGNALGMAIGESRSSSRRSPSCERRR